MIISSIHQFIEHHKLVPHGSRVVLGLSGGPDSVFLLHALLPLHQSGHINLIAAHLDHGWRAESQNDVDFCQRLAAQHGVRFVAEHARNLSPRKKFNGSQEELGRTLRRQFFERLADEHGSALIALAHHLQDQQETFFLRLVRGSSLSGLTCMKIKNGRYIRPLLETAKADILAYLHQNQISYLVDSTNDSHAFLRNRIRHIALPALEKCDQRFNANFTATLHKLQETEQFLETLTRSSLESAVQKIDDQWHLHLPTFFSFHPIMQHRVLVAWLCHAQATFTPSESFFDEIIRFLRQPTTASHSLHPTWHIAKSKDLACISIIPVLRSSAHDRGMHAA